MSPKEFYGLPVNAEVKLRLAGVPLSCASTAENEPCALPYDDLDLPSYFCNWRNDAGSTAVMGPVAANVSFHSSINASTRASALAQIHGAHMSPCANGCQKSPPWMTAVLICPLASDTPSLLGSDGSGTLHLDVTYSARKGASGAVSIPFVDATNSVVVQLAPPPPPAPPASPPPSPATPPPPDYELQPWYAVVPQAQMQDGAFTDQGVRIVPVYLEEPTPYSYTTLKAKCVGKGMRTWRDEGCSTNSEEICDSMSTNLGGHDLISNIVNQMTDQVDTGHGGWGMAMAKDMLEDFSAINMKIGEHTAAIKYGHAGMTGSDGTPSMVKFTINSGYTGLSSVSSVHQGSTGQNFDVALCACIVGEDCPPKPTHEPGILWKWYGVTSVAYQTTSAYNDLGIRMIPLYLGSSKSYSYPVYKSLCNAKGLRVWRDDTGCSTTSTEICDPANAAPSLGGHDIASNVAKAMNQEADTSHSGWMQVWKRDMLVQFEQAEVPIGTHTMALKYHHTGQTGSSDPASSVSFSIDAGYKGLSGAQYNSQLSAGNPFDIALCACIIGEDCPKVA